MTFVEESAGALLFAALSQGVKYGREVGVIPSIATGTRIDTEDIVTLVSAAAVDKLGEFRRVGKLMEAGSGGLSYSVGKIVSKLWVKAIAGV